MAKHRTRPTHSTAFKRRVVEEYLAGEPLHGVACRHDPSRTLIRIRVDKYEAGTFDEGSEAADTLQEYEARIAAEVRGPGQAARRLWEDWAPALPSVGRGDSWCQRWLPRPLPVTPDLTRGPGRAARRFRENWTPGQARGTERSGAHDGDREPPSARRDASIAPTGARNTPPAPTVPCSASTA